MTNNVTKLKATCEANYLLGKASKHVTVDSIFYIEVDNKATYRVIKFYNDIDYRVVHGFDSLASAYSEALLYI